VAKPTPSSGWPPGGPLSVERLTVEYADQPLGTDISRPRLAWVASAPGTARLSRHTRCWWQGGLNCSSQRWRMSGSGSGMAWSESVVGASRAGSMMWRRGSRCSGPTRAGVAGSIRAPTPCGRCGRPVRGRVTTTSRERWWSGSRECRRGPESGRRLGTDPGAARRAEPGGLGVAEDRNGARAGSRVVAAEREGPSVGGADSGGRDGRGTGTSRAGSRRNRRTRTVRRDAALATRSTPWAPASGTSSAAPPAELRPLAVREAR
jgi:hypothetical protein